MKAASRYLSLPRRLLSQYFMFGLLSIVVLGAILFFHDRHTHHGVESDQILRLQEIRSMIQSDLAAGRVENLQLTLNLLALEDWVSCAALVSPDGKVMAHSSPNKIGQDASLQTNIGTQDALIKRHIINSDGSSSREYLIAVPTSDQQFSYLQVGLLPAHGHDWLQVTANRFSISILGPLGVLIIGAVCLFKSTRTHAAIENQLCAASAAGPAGELRLRPVSRHEPEAEGWNRIVNHLSGSRTTSTLDASLSKSLASLQQQRFETFLNAMPDGLVVTDKDGCISYSNRAFAVLTHSRDAVRSGERIQKYLPANQDNPIADQHALRPVVFELKLGNTDADGVLRVGRYPVIVEETSSAQQYVWTVRDVTQQKLADEMRTQFVYSATHELRTPLANIKAYAETLTMSELTDPEQQKAFLNTINSEATRLGRFVEELLNISQMEAGSLSLSRQEVDMGRLLHEVADKLQPQMHQKNLTFDVVLPNKMPKATIDKDKFVGAVVNLLGNAAKYTPENGRVTLKANLSDSEMQISVEDTGYGISKDDLPKLFTKFFRSEDTRVRDVVGSGLGLSFANEVIRHHGGKLLVHSELNKGSQFVMVLPI